MRSERDGSLAHVAGRLAAVEARLRAEVERRRRGDPTPDDRFRGLYFSDQHLDRLLDASPAPAEAAEETPDPATDLRSRVEAEADAREAAGTPLRLRRLAATFGLDDLDVELLLVPLAPEVDPRLEQLFAYLHDDVTRRRPSTGLALALCGRSPLDAAARARLRPGAPLVDGGLLMVEDRERPFLSRSLRMPDRVVMHLLGDDRPDDALTGCLAPAEPLLAGDPAPLAAAMAGGAALVYLRAGAGASGGGLAAATFRELGLATLAVDAGLAAAMAGGAALVYLRAGAGASGGGLAAATFRELGLATLAVDAGRLAADADIPAIAAAAVREARLAGAGLVVGPVERLAERGPAAVRLFTEAGWPIVLTGASHWDPAWSRAVPLAVDVPVPGAGARAEAWRAAMGDVAPGLDAATATESFKLDGPQIARAATAAWLQSLLDGRPPDAERLRAGARAQNTVGLERLARRIEPRFGWNDLVLPPRPMELLCELAARVHLRSRVLDAWGMRRTGRAGEGVTALFAGPSGTGKTMAAEVIARDLGLDLYAIDLAMVVDKYIGETEKNLDRIFTEAERVNGVLFFDEADALFGKRSDVKDAHDRYANVETAYLLQRMEAFDGIAILATNLRANLDDAFARRLDALIDFPMPDQEQRRRLWEACLPAGVPRHEDVDLEFCARSFAISGGNVRNVALTAAFFAANADRPVTMADLVRGVEREYRKLGRLCVAAEFGPYLSIVEAR